MKILIVDDSSAIRKLVRHTLQQAGYVGHDVEEAEDGKQALDMITTSSPDLVLCDWEMPEMTGIELLEALKEGDVQVSFCFVTSGLSPEMQSRARDAGAFGFVTKPFTARTLEDALGDLLR